LTIETLVNGGAGLARHEGRVIFVPHTAVGDRVRCRIVSAKKQYAEAQLLEVLEPASKRRRPPCVVAGDCGGCQWQHLSYAEQLHWKGTLFRETLVRRCGVDPAQVHPIVASAAEWNYRSRVQLKCHVSQQGFICGFYRAKSRYVMAVDECPLIAPELNILTSKLRCLFSNTSYARQIPQIDLAIDDHKKTAVTVHYLGVEGKTLAERLLQADLNSDLVIQFGAKSRRTLIHGDGILRIQVGDPLLELAYSVGGFAQINLDQNRELVAEVLELAELQGTENVVDLYCGMGNFSLPLARRAARLVGIEDSPISIEFARKNAAVSGIANADFHCGPAETLFSARTLCDAVDLLVLDPPRSGAYEVMKSLVEHPVSKVIYVSCDPQTLARDLQPLLHNGYELISSRPFDMFPQTFHCESVTFLKYCDDSSGSNR